VATLTLQEPDRERERGRERERERFLIMTQIYCKQPVSKSHLLSNGKQFTNNTISSGFAGKQNDVVINE
jgi:hypothetical protein